MIRSAIPTILVLLLQYCGQYIWTPTVDSFFMIGLLAGSFIFGVLSDKIGRRHTLLLASLTCALGNLAGAFVSNKWGYAALRLTQIHTHPL